MEDINQNLEKKTEELIKKAETIATTSTDSPVEPPVWKCPPSGVLASMIVRTKEDLTKVPPQFLPLVSKDGEPLPHWHQVANLMNHKDKKVAIVGFADTKDQAPYQDPTWEIWALNDLHGYCPRVTRHFDIHPRENIDQDYMLARNQGQTPPENIGLSGLRKLSMPVYMQDVYPDIPNSIKFPLKEMVEFWEKRNLAGAKYLTNSIAIMIAFALFDGITSGVQYKNINIFGVDMAVGSEYVDQRPSCEYWIGVAEGMGVKVFIPPASDLLKTRFIYGFEQEQQDVYNLKIENMLKNMDARRAQIMQQEQQAHDARMQFEGAAGATKEIKKIWANMHDKI